MGVRLTGALLGRLYRMRRSTPETGSSSVPIGDSISTLMARNLVRWKYPYMDACDESDIARPSASAALQARRLSLQWAVANATVRRRRGNKTRPQEQFVATVHCPL